MQRTNVGPRGWAILCLIGGAFFTSTFMRRSPSSPDASPTKSPTYVVANSELHSSDLQSSSAPIGDVLSSDNARERLNAQVAAQLVAKELPAASLQSGTQVRSLPQWAKPASALDQLIRQGPPAASLSPELGRLEPLETWRDTQPNATARHQFQQTDLAYRESPWEAPGQDSSRGATLQSGVATNRYANTAQQASPQAWPATDPGNLRPSLQSPSHPALHAGSSSLAPHSGMPSVASIGSLVGSARREPEQNPLAPQEPSPSHQQPPAANAQIQRRFVYQPGYIGGD